ncbi:MAG: T9SS type A sorting domain-containing protein [Candidatus Eisenbacteria bacterium]|nr:T9SS type A sorting domain-containing protein [Candidatus Eisenbacteria bacterium]
MQPSTTRTATRLVPTLVAVWLLVCPCLSAAVDVGVIRWDAWVGDLATPGWEAEESLGPSEFHWKAPFYSILASDHQILARATTQEIIDAELQYACEAGIDYFAYIYYPDALGTARELHFTSSRREDVEFAIIIEPGRWSQDFVSLLASDYFAKSYYKTVRIERVERPLLFLFDCDASTASYVSSLRAACDDAGINPPYVVAMRPCAGVDWDARGDYAIFGANGEPFASLAARAVDTWNSHRVAGHRVVPLVTSGWDPRPRMVTRNPVPWTSPPTSSYAQPGTAEEIADHLQDGLDWVAANPGYAEADAVLVYAWNEFSEGGWVCPTKGEGDARLEAIAATLGTGPVSAPDGVTIPPPAPLPDPGPGGFLENSSFELGDQQEGAPNWSAQTCRLQKVWKTFTFAGEQALKAWDRTACWSSPVQDICGDLEAQGPGHYYVSARARWRTGADSLMIVVKTTDDAGDRWFVTPWSNVTETYAPIGGPVTITWSGQLESAILYVQSQSDADGELFLDDFFCDRSDAAAVGEQGDRGDQPAQFAFARHYPNPARARTTIECRTRMEGRLDVAIYDVRGRRVKTLWNDAAKAGNHRICWDGTDARGALVPNGLYFYRLVSGGESLRRRVLLVR